jgi:pyruvate carboxylase subunit B
MEIEANGRLRRVAARRTGSRWAVDIDGTPFDVQAARVGARWSLLIGPADRAATGRVRAFRSFDVVVDDRPDGHLVVHIDGRTVPVSIPRLRRHGRSSGVPASAAEERPCRVVAPMPGRVVKLLVKPGDRVEARQGLVVVEAMKMENELRASVAGQVSEVRVSEGALVEAGTILVVVE